jgi:hypothetical protein
MIKMCINPLNAELHPFCHLLALSAHHILHVSGLRVNPHVKYPLFLSDFNET